MQGKSLVNSIVHLVSSASVFRPAHAVLQDTPHIHTNHSLSTALFQLPSPNNGCIDHAAYACPVSSADCVVPTGDRPNQVSSPATSA